MKMAFWSQLTPPTQSAHPRSLGRLTVVSLLRMVGGSPLQSTRLVFSRYHGIPAYRASKRYYQLRTLYQLTNHSMRTQLVLVKQSVWLIYIIAIDDENGFVCGWRLLAPVSQLVRSGGSSHWVKTAVWSSAARQSTQLTNYAAMNCEK